MFIPYETPKTPYYYKVRKFEGIISFLGIAVPMLWALWHCVEHSHKVASENYIRGVTTSPYFPNYKIDQEDGQLKDFLANLPLLSLVAAIFIVLKTHSFTLI